MFPRSCATRARRARHAARLRGAAAVRRADGLRRALSAADPSDRPRAAQGPQQRARRAPGRTSAARGRSARPRAATRRASASSARSRTFARWSRRARAHGLEIALDIAFQCAPDHPYVARASRSGSAGGPTARVQYAENPPKKYQDIYPFDFESRRLGRRCGASSQSVFDFWIGEGVRIFRVDNPHTKPFAFWEWVIARIKREHPDVIFLAEAFTRPQGDAPAGQARLHAVLHLLHLAQHQARADRVLHRARRRARGATTSGPTAGRTRRTSCPSTCSSAGAPRSWRAWCSRRRWRRTTASTGRPSSCSSTTPREPGSEEYLDSEKYQLRALGPRARRQPRRLHRARQRRAARQPGAAARRRPALRAGRQRRADLLRESRRRTARTRCWSSSTSIRTTRSRAGSTLDLAALGLDADAAVPGARPADRRALPVERRAQLRAARSGSVRRRTSSALRRRVRTERDFDYFL